MIERKLIEKLQYGGNSEPMQKELSASAFGSDILQLWLRYKHGVIEKDTFGQDMIGSIAHIGIQELLKDEYEVEKKYKLKMHNGWSLTGSIDLMNDKEIVDIKITKQYTYEKVIKDKFHQYNQQLSVYKYLVKKIDGIDLDIKLLLLLKDGGFSFKKGIIEPSIVEVDVKYLGDEFVENKFKRLVDEIEKYDLTGSKPPKCEDVWIRKIKGKAIPVRCEQYCSYKNVCPYYKTKPIFF